MYVENEKKKLRRKPRSLAKTDGYESTYTHRIARTYIHLIRLNLNTVFIYLGETRAYFSFDLAFLRGFH